MSPRAPLSELFLRTQSDERLCALSRDGHELAFAVLVKRHRPALLRSAVRMTGATRAEDIVQEALLRAWRALEAGTGVRQAQAWLHQIVRNTAITTLKGDRAVCPLPGQLADRDDPGDLFEARTRAHMLLAEIAALPERQREALLRTEVDGLSRHEIAADLDLSEGAVRQLVHRARASLRAALTALTPYPLVSWIARRPLAPGLGWRLTGTMSPTVPAHSGIAESLSAGSTAVGAGALAKGGAVILAAGALGGGLAWHVTFGHRSSAGTRDHAAVRIHSVGDGTKRPNTASIADTSDQHAAQRTDRVAAADRLARRALRPAATRQSRVALGAGREPVRDAAPPTLAGTGSVSTVIRQGDSTDLGAARTGGSPHAAATPKATLGRRPSAPIAAPEHGDAGADPTDADPVSGQGTTDSASEVGETIAGDGGGDNSGTGVAADTPAGPIGNSNAGTAGTSTDTTPNSDAGATTTDAASLSPTQADASVGTGN